MAITTHTPRIRDEAQRLADWIEFDAIIASDGIGSLYKLARQLGIAATGDSLDENEEEPRQFVDNPKLDEVMAELEDRARACGDGYPFEIDSDGNTITRKNGWDSLTYTHLLLFSLIDCKLGVGPAGAELIFPARLFEALCVVAAAEYLGGPERGAKSFHFGAPRPDNSGFSDALTALAREVKGSNRLEHIDPAMEKDDGLDVLAWREFADERSNFVCLFGQCATGDDWAGKNPAPTKFIDVWLRLETRAVNAALFVPFTLTKSEWVKNSLTSIIFDRCRISLLVPSIQNIAFDGQMRALASELLAA